MSECTLDKSIADNRGFTLTELIVCVAILSIASVVLMKSFSLATITNGKAQRMQNATSLAESVMEEIKSSGIKQLQKVYNGGEDVVVSIATHTDTEFSALPAPTKLEKAQAAAAGATSALVTGGTATSPYYVLYKTGVTATMGGTYNVTATMRTSPYSQVPTDATPIPNASDANSIKLPVIEEIDTHTKTVLTAKELNKYDIAAADYFREHTIEGTLTLKSKEILIEKFGDGEADEDSEIKVKCTVTYTASDDSTKYSKEVFTGTYVSKKDKAGNQLAVDNDIYVFYNRYLASNEKILVNDQAENDAHKVYVIFQKNLADDSDITSISGTTIEIKHGTDSKISVSSNLAINYDDHGETVYGRTTNDGYWLITNLGKSAGSDGSMLEKKAKNRIFDVTVDVTKAGEDTTYASITSTVDVRE